MSVTDWIGICTAVIGITTLALTYRLIKHGIAQIEVTRRLMEAGIAAEVRTLNGACKPQRRRVAQAFPLHADFVGRYEPHRWEVSVNGERLEIERFRARRNYPSEVLPCRPRPPIY